MDISHELQQDDVRMKRRNYIYLTARLLTGFLLTHKGIFFISHSKELEDWIRKTAFGEQVSFFVSYITFAHLLGGTFIFIGLLTRISVVLQIPIIIAAIYYGISAAFGITAVDMIMSVIALPLLVYIAIKGGGKFSMDNYLKKHVL